MGRFAKGHSGNPGGKIKNHELRDLARSYTQEAVERAVAIMRGEDDNNALMAVRLILDRGWGKPVQGILYTDEDGNPQAPVAPILNITMADPDLVRR